MLRLGKLPFMIYSPSRTGSTTLQRMLCLHPGGGNGGGLRCLWEPFNPTHPAGFAVRSREILKERGLEAALEYLATEGTGFKHVWHPGGWPFEEGKNEGGGLNDRMLLMEDEGGGSKVIMLRRRNALQRAISERISQQMGIWQIFNEGDRQRIRGHTFRPLNVEQLRMDMAVVQAEERRLIGLLAGSGKTWREVSYEEIFSPTVAFDDAVEVVQGIFKWLGAGRVTDRARIAAMREMLDPTITGFNNAAAYRKIPNIEEVERALGSEENGWVFPQR
ncbi:MAG: hypothetical protein FWD61_14640 [Phycisphaerales bacterium]|nr:hypothetical protein [Phycisphaerales bacterium]